LGDDDVAVEWLNRATPFNPRRNENYLRMWNINQSEEAKAKLLDPARTNPFPEYTFLILNAAYWDTNPNMKEMLGEAQVENTGFVDTTQMTSFSASGVL